MTNATASKCLCFLISALIVSFILLPSPSASTYNLDTHIGLYRVTRTKCEVSEDLPSTCSEIKYIELVKGRFYGIGAELILNAVRVAGKKSSDPIVKKAVIDTDLKSTFFDSHSASYRWYIVQKADGAFENILGEAVTPEDEIPVTHTADCISTHQGAHRMTFCDAILVEGVLYLKIYGGLPAYSGVLFIEIKRNLEFTSYFKAVYPVFVDGLRWTLQSKEMTLKRPSFSKGERMCAWVSVVIAEHSVYKGVERSEIFKIEGFVKPVVR